MKYLLYFSFLCLLYLIMIIGMSYFHIIIPGKAGIIFGVFYEMLTIPVLLAVPTLTVICSILWYKARFSGTVTVFYAFLINIVSLVIMITATLLNS